jgi:hypothetical protein
MAGLISFQNYVNSMFGDVLKMRKEYFNEEFMRQFEMPHKMFFGTKPSPFGYPDMGSGRYSKRLTYKQWYDFNIAQRNHNNTVEHLTYCLPSMLLLGLFYPVYAMGLGSVVLVGRQCYIAGYKTGGPNSKL